MTSEDLYRVVIAGGGVAALEATLALRDLAGEQVSLELVAPDPTFSYRPLSVAEPFGYAAADQYLLAEIAGDAAADLLADELVRIEPAKQIAYTRGGAALEYDALVLAVGARMSAPFPHALTIDDRRIDKLVYGLLEDIEDDFVRSIAFVSPGRMAWPLPLYELALMTARRAHEEGISLEITIATPEYEPLAVFGAEVSHAVAGLLRESGIGIFTSAWVQVPEFGRLVIQPGERWLDVDRIVALPKLFGPAVRGLQTDANGFIPVDLHGHVRDMPGVYAAGDATDFAVKFGGVAAQQADAVAQSIAALAGAAVTPVPFRPEIRGVLLTGGRPLYLHANITGGHGLSSEVTDEPTWSPVAKIDSKYLAPYLDRLGRAAALH